jgi:hypothetical protein
MKKILLYTVSALLLVSNYSCKKYLDQVPDDRLTFQQLYEKKATVDQALANVYSTLPNQVMERDASASGNIGPWTAASDEADYTLPNFAENVNTGAWDATSAGKLPLAKLLPGHTGSKYLYGECEQVYRL